MKHSKEKYENLAIVKEPIRAWRQDKNIEIILNKNEMIFVTKISRSQVFLDYEKSPFVISADDYKNKTRDYVF